MKIAVILPVFNEEKRINEVLVDISRIKLPVIFINDGSADTTEKIIEKKIKNNSKISLLNHQINLGKGAALRTGAEAAFNLGFEAVIFMDADGQHSSSDLIKFVDKLKTKKYDIILGTRNLRHGAPLVRLLGNKFASKLISVLFGLYVSDILCGFRGMTRECFQKINFESSGYGIETEMIVKISKYKLRICEIPVETIYYDKHKGVTLIDAFNVLFDVLKWRIIL